MISLNRKTKPIVFFAGLLLVSLFFTSCMNDTSYPGDQNIVEAKAVKEKQSDAQVLIIDARGEESYNKGHVEGAIELSPQALVVNEPIKAMLAPKPVIEKVLGQKGIQNDQTLYIYDDNGGVSAGRLWWTLKVYGHEKVMIVNGGAKALVDAGVALSDEKTKREATTYQAQEQNTQWIATYDEVKDAVENPQEKVKIIDVRSRAEYDEGYIPTAILYPHTQNLYGDGTFMSPRDIALFYGDEGIHKEDTLILYCKSSFRAAQTFALLQEAGFKNLKIYDGAWLEWAEKSGGDVQKVEEKAPVTQQEGS